jgi:uncharacterized protein involved in tolerance to divalent cations
MARSYMQSKESDLTKIHVHIKISHPYKLASVLMMKILEKFSAS